jgi:hypothetical protein
MPVEAQKKPTPVRRASSMSSETQETKKEPQETKQKANEVTFIKAERRPLPPEIATKCADALAALRTSIDWLDDHYEHKFTSDDILRALNSGIPTSELTNIFGEEEGFKLTDLRNWFNRFYEDQTFKCASGESQGAIDVTTEVSLSSSNQDQIPPAIKAMAGGRNNMLVLLMTAIYHGQIASVKVREDIANSIFASPSSRVTAPTSPEAKGRGGRNK